ncbi:hypothetical protein FHG87_014877 [Trinorchestia longiramus]|nr:hypothetical protein FHG87_014877 [Trinorchestia longiramus]
MLAGWLGLRGHGGWADTVTLLVLAEASTEYFAQSSPQKSNNDLKQHELLEQSCVEWVALCPSDVDLLNN